MRRFKLTTPKVSKEDMDIAQKLEQELNKETTEQENTPVENNPPENTPQETSSTQEGSEMVDVVASSVVQATETDSTVSLFTETLAQAYEKARENGFTGDFTEYLKSVTQSIQDKTENVPTNPLGTTDGAGGVAVIDSSLSDSGEVIEKTKEDDADLNEEPATETSEETSPDKQESVEVTEEKTEEVLETKTEDESDETKETDAQEEPSETSEETTETSEETENEEPASEESTDDSQTDLNDEPVESDEESEDQEQSKAPGVDEPEGDEDKDLDEYVDEIDEDDMDEEDEMVEEAIDTSSRLGRIAEIVKEAIEEAKEGDEEEANEALAKISQLATECLIETVGGSVSASMPTISNENYSDRSGVIYRLQVSNEAISDTVKKIYEAFKRYAIQFMEMISDKYNKIRMATGLTQRRVTKLQEKLNNFQTKNPKPSDLESTSISELLAISNFIEANSLPNAIKEYTTMGSVVFSVLTDWATDVVQKIDKTGADVNKIIYDIELPPPDYSKLGFTENIEKSDTVFKATTKPILGNNVFTITWPIAEDLDNITSAMKKNKIGVSFVKIKHRDAASVLDKLPCLNEKQIKECVKNTDELVKLLNDFKSKSAKLDRIRSNIKQSILRMNASLGDPGVVSGIVARFKTALYMIDEPSVSFTTNSLKVINAVCSYVEKSMSELSKEPSESKLPSGDQAQPA